MKRSCLDRNLKGIALLSLFGLLACSSEEGEARLRAGAFLLASVVINPGVGRTTYVQTLDSLDDGPFDNRRTIETAGNAVVVAGAEHFFIGMVESPTWHRYSANEAGFIERTGSVSLARLDSGRVPFGNVWVSPEIAVSVLTRKPEAVVWNPSTMKIRGRVALPHLRQDGFKLEAWSTTTHNGLVYIPARYVNWEAERVRNGVSITIVDPRALRVVAIAEDDRCASGGRVVFDDAGYGYVVGDGRNYVIHMYANKAGGTAPDNCILRIPPGGTDFEANYFYTIPSLTGGLQSSTELETAIQGSGIGFAKMFYPDRLPAGVEPFTLGLWDHNAHKMWRIELKDPPTAREVQDIPFSRVGFIGSMLDGKLYSGETQDGRSTDVFEIDPVSGTARKRFTMQGYFNGLYGFAK